MHRSLLALTAIAASPMASAAALSAGFDSPEYTIDNVAADVAGQNGWTIDDATADVSFFVAWGYLGSAEENNGAAIGGYLDSPTGPRAELAHTYGDSLVSSLTTLKFAVHASTTDYPGSDSFALNFRDGSATSVLTLALEPNPSFADRLEIVWYDGASVRTETGYDLFYGGSYDFALEFTGSGTDAGFSAEITGADTLPFSGTLSGAAASTLQTFGVSITRDPAAADYGDNYIAFDNVSIAVVPEPATSLLVIAGLIAGARRRRR